jgi:taurine dioxygenase
MNDLSQKTMLTVNKLSEHIGAEVTGIDLRQPVDEATRQQLYDALVDNIALVIRDQQFTPAQFLAAVRLFGEPMSQNNSEMALPDVPLVNRLSNRDKNASGKPVKSNSRWHTDGTNKTYPPKFTTLYAVELPDKGGATSVCNMRAGFQSLPEELRQRIDGMKTVNVRLGSAVKKENQYNSAAIEAQKLNPTPALHPLVRTNPDHGSKALYFHPNKTENIVGMSPQDSQDLLDDLVSRAVRPEFVYTHKWRLGDMLIWDNRSSLHKAHFDFDPHQYRTLYRVIVKGELPQ